MLTYLRTLYHIVPKGSGETYLGIDDEGNHIVVRKEGPINVSLLFETEDQAQRYINKNLDSSYIPECIGISDKHYDIKPTVVEE